MLAEKLDAAIDLALPRKLHGLFSRRTRLSPHGDWCSETDGGDEEHLGEVRLHADTHELACSRNRTRRAVIGPDLTAFDGLLECASRDGIDPRYGFECTR